jgi:hypothetical protein
MTAFNDTFGIIGFSSENVGIDRRIYTGLTSTNPQLNVSYNGGRVDVYLNGVKLMGNHSGQSNYDYTYQSTGSGSAITLSTGVALVATDTIECVGYVSNSSNTVTTYTPSVSAGNNTFTSISHTSSDLLNVFLNGVLLDPSDYTADASADTVAITSLASGDVVHIQVIGALDHSNFVPESGGTFSGNVSFGDNNITNVGDIALDTISSDAGTSIGVTLGTDAGDDFNVGSGKLVVEGDTGRVGVNTSDPDVTLDIHDANPAIDLYDTGTNGYCRIDANGANLTLHADKGGNAGSSTVKFGVDNSVKMTIDSSGNVGIGTDPNNKLHVRGSDTTSCLVVGNTTENTQFEVIPYQDDKIILRSNDGGSARNLTFETGTTERMRIASGGDVTVSTGNLVIGTAGQGINFSAYATSGNPSSNLLDDYEEGTWTPTLLGTTTAGTYGYDTSRTNGTYTKIGNQVFVRGVVRVNSTTTAGTGEACIGGLPFAPSTSDMGSFSRVPYPLFVQGGPTLSYPYIFAAVENTNNRVHLYYQDYSSSTSNPVNIGIADADKHNALWCFTAHYTTA